jgi:hypothetical protein
MNIHIKLPIVPASFFGLILGVAGHHCDRYRLARAPWKLGLKQITISGSTRSPKASSANN